MYIYIFICIHVCLLLGWRRKSGGGRTLGGEEVWGGEHKSEKHRMNLSGS